MTGLIYVAIVALWAAVLIPMWLSRHDDSEASRLERHQEAMGILARFRNGDSADWTPARRAARRRRTILATLIAITVTGAVAWILQVAGAWVVVLPGLALLAFVGSAAWATRMATPRLSAATQVTTRNDVTAAQAEQRQRRRAERRERVAVEQAAQRPGEQDGYPTTRRTHYTEVIVTPPSRTRRDREALEGTGIDQAAGDQVAHDGRGPRRPRPAWDQVFDQTA